MIIIKHRINTVEELKQVPTHFGVEIDMRSFNNELILHHDPFHKGELFKNWIKFFNHKLVILNIKEEGLEKKIIEELNKYKVENYFFLDQSFPFLIKTALNGENRTAVRISEYESINTAISLNGKVSWIWVDYFTKLNLSKDEFLNLKKFGFNICFVSPELQGLKSEITFLQKELLKKKIYPDAVCTKMIENWINFKI